MSQQISKKMIFIDPKNKFSIWEDKDGTLWFHDNTSAR